VSISPALRSSAPLWLFQSVLAWA